jgi:hypothetical protein
VHPAGDEDVLLADVDLQGKAHLLQMLTRCAGCPA